MPDGKTGGIEGRSSLRAAVIRALLAVAAVVAQGAENRIGMLRVVDSGVYIPLRDLGLTYTVGKRLPLFQETRDYYVVKVSTPEYGERLCAFPVRNRRGEGTAWVTNEKLLIFGRETSSCAGRFYFSRGELIPVLAEGPNGYLVEISRFGRKVQLVVPKGQPGFQFVKAPPAQPTAPTPPSAEEVKQITVPPPAPTQTGTVTVQRVHHAATGAGREKPAPRPRTAALEAKPRETGHAPAAGRPAATGAEEEAGKEYIIEIKIPKELQPPAEKAPAPAPTGRVMVVARASRPARPAAAPSSAKAVTRAAPAVSAETAPGVPQAAGPGTSTGALPASAKAAAAGASTAEVTRAAEAAPPTPVSTVSAPPPTVVVSGGGFWSGLGLVALQIVLVVVVIEAILILRLKRQLASSSLPVAEQVEFVTVGETSPTDFYLQLAEEEGDFSGVLVNLSLAELVQLLHNTEDTGVLLLKNSEGSIIGQFFFKNGEVIDAFYEEDRGSEAFKRAFYEEAAVASFAFKRKPLSGRRRTIREQTIKLLMEAVKDSDETGKRGGGIQPGLDGSDAVE